jgi:hypothetical protein
MNGIPHISNPSRPFAELLRQCYDYPPGYKYIDDAPDGWPYDDGEGR